MKLILLFFTCLSCCLSNWTIYDFSSLGDNIWHFYLDNNDNCWFAVGPSGIYKFDGTNTIYYDTNNTHLPFMSINCITQGQNGDMYFGNYTVTSQPHKKVSVMRFDGENWEFFDDTNSPMLSVDVWDILVTGENEFLVATYMGLYHYKNGNWDSYFQDENDFRRNIYSLAIDRNNNLYFTNDFLILSGKSGK